MQKYVALLRGVNVGGKNKISMAELKIAFEKSGFLNVNTYINSGNIVFSSNIKNKRALAIKIKCIIENRFNISIPLTIISAKELSDILKNAPDWWDTGDKEIYDNAIFVISPASTEYIFKEVGEAKVEYEKVDSYKDVIFWSAILKTFNKTRWSKIASSSVNNNVTIRNANTIKKLLELVEK